MKDLQFVYRHIWRLMLKYIGCEILQCKILKIATVYFYHSIPILWLHNTFHLLVSLVYNLSFSLCIFYYFIWWNVEFLLTNVMFWWLIKLCTAGNCLLIWVDFWWNNIGATKIAQTSCGKNNNLDFVKIENLICPSQNVFLQLYSLLLYC